MKKKTQAFQRIVCVQCSYNDFCSFFTPCSFIRDYLYWQSRTNVVVFFVFVIKKFFFWGVLKIFKTGQQYMYYVSKKVGTFQAKSTILRTAKADVQEI